MAIPSFLCRSDEVRYQRFAVDRLSNTLALMRAEGIPELSTPFQIIVNMRSQVQAQLGLKIPRSVSVLMRLFGLSPGIIQLWIDDEAGFMVEARVKPGAPPIYHYVSDGVGVAILKKEVTPELHDWLFEPDDYLGE